MHNDIKYLLVNAEEAVDNANATVARHGNGHRGLYENGIIIAKSRKFNKTAQSGGPKDPKRTRRAEMSVLIRCGASSKSNILMICNNYCSSSQERGWETRSKNSLSEHNGEFPLAPPRNPCLSAWRFHKQASVQCFKI